jgi:hypothetical protein
MKKNLLYLCSSILFLILSINTQAQTTDWLWAKSACDLSFATSITAISTDPSGNIFIAGSFRDSARFGGIVFHPVGTMNMFVAKYDSSGNFLWILPALGTNVPPYNLITDICTDSSGNCYFTGFFNGNITMSHDTITSLNSMPDVFVGKVTASGNVEWLQQGTGPSSDYAYGIGLDADGNCYIGGSFEQSISFGSLQLSANNSSYDVFILKLDGNGNFLSAKSAGGTAIDLIKAMAVDENGNCFVTGTFTSPDIVFGSDTLYYTNSGADAFVAKFDSAGNALWGNIGSGPGNQEPASIASDQNGNCYVTGVFKADTMYLDTFTLITYSYWDFFTAKYDSSGNLTWAGHQGGSSFGAENSNGIAADTAGNFYTTGLFRTPATFDTINVTSISASDIFVTKFNATGSAEWVEQSGSGSGGLTSSSIHIDNSGNIFIAGSYEASTLIGYDSLVVQPGFTAGYYIAKIGAIDTTTTGVMAVPGKNFSIYPNPATNELWIGNADPGDELWIIDMLGNTVYTSGVETNRINISNLASGLYIVELRSASGIRNHLLIKE